MRIFLTIGVCLVFVSIDTIAEAVEHTASGTILPYDESKNEFDNSDLTTLVREAERFSSAANQCNAYDCPVVNCAQASQHFEYLKQMRFALRNQYYWTKKAADSFYSDLMSHIRENISDTDLVRRAEFNVFMQLALKDAGNVLLDVTSLADQAKNWSENPVVLSELRPEEVAGLFDDLYETTKDVKSLHDRYREGTGIPNNKIPIINLPDGVGLSGDELDTLKSHVSDMKTIVDDFDRLANSGQSLRDTLSGPGAAASKVALGQIIGRILTGVADKRIDAAEQSIRELKEIIRRRQGQQANLYDYYQPYAGRRDATEDAYLAYNRLLIIGESTGGEYTSCIQKTCTNLSLNYTVDPGVPRRYIGDPSHDVDYGAHWAEAIPFWHARIAELRSFRPALPDISSPPPRLALSSVEVEPGKGFKVDVVAPACADASYSVRLINDIGRHVSGTPVRESSSVLNWKAPSAVGSYQLELLRNEIPVDSANLTVSDPNLLVGIWSVEYQDAERGIVTGRLAVHPGNKVNGEFDGDSQVLRSGRLNLSGDRVTGTPLDVRVDMLVDASGDRLTGTWSGRGTSDKSYGDARNGVDIVWDNPARKYWFTASGEEEWTRIRQSITAVKLRKPSEGADYDDLVETCDLAVVPGNYPDFALDIIGTGFPTWEYNWDLKEILKVSFPNEPNIIINSISTSKGSEEDVIHVIGWLRCYPDSTTPLIIQPGTKSVMVNDVSFDWDLSFANYSGPPPISRMEFVESQASDFRAIKAPVAMGDIVHVEVEFESAPSEDAIDVDVHVSESSVSGRTISVKRVEESDTIYRSAAVRIVP